MAQKNFKLSRLLFLAVIWTTQVDLVTGIDQILTSKQQTLNHLLPDPVLQRIYITASNHLYIRDENLEYVQTVTLGPKNDSVYCSPDPAVQCECNETMENANSSCRTPVDNVNKVLFKQGDDLILCNTLFYGSCMTISLDDFSMQQYYVPVVGPSTVSKVIITPLKDSNSKVYVAVEQGYNKTGLPLYLNEIHPLSARRISTGGDAWKLSSETGTSASRLFFSGSYQREKFPVKYHFSFVEDKYVYFVLTRPEKQIDGGNKTYLGRLCKDDDAFNSYAEIELQCGDNQMGDYLTAHYGAVGLHLTSFWNLGNDKKEVLYVMYTGDICMYKIGGIQSDFRRMADYCFSGEGSTGPEYLTTPKKCIRKV